MSSSKKVNFSPSMSTNSGSSGMLYLRCAGSLPMLSASSRLSYHSRSEEHTSELQSLMRISYAVFCLKKKNIDSRLQDKEVYNFSHVMYLGQKRQRVALQATTQ